MSIATTLNKHIVDSLYTEALLLSDEVRGAFDLSGQLGGRGKDEDLARIALSCEALRTTTRMMHVIAWLLNQKAYFNGEISELQLRRQGRLTNPSQQVDPAQLALLDADILALVERTRQFHQRIERLDRAWRERFDERAGAVLRLREKLGEAVRGF